MEGKQLLRRGKSRWKKGKSWQITENKGLPLVSPACPPACQYYSIRYPSPPTEETLAGGLIYAATYICKAKIKLDSPHISYDITFTTVWWYWTPSGLLNSIERVPSPVSSGLWGSSQTRTGCKDKGCWRYAEAEDAEIKGADLLLCFWHWDMQGWLFR